MKRINRRQLISGLGLMGCAFPLSAADKEVPGHFRFYDSLPALKSDQTLQVGMVVCTAGYYNAGDGGNALYRVIKTPERPDSGLVRLNDDLSVKLIHVQSVNYAMFGAIGDGINDDGVQIKEAHLFANEQNLPVVNLHGEYWIKETNSIPIKTIVQWGNTVFHLDEQYNTQRDARFDVLSTQEPVEIRLDEEAKKNVLSKLKPGVTMIEELSSWKNCLVFIVNDQVRIGVRAGKRYNNRQSWALEEFFYVEEHGRIIGDIAWTFSDYTSLIAYPAEDNYLVIDGGTFYLSGNNPGAVYNGYWQNGFRINRSRTIIRNQWVGLEKGKSDLSVTPRSGFYGFSKVYDVMLENVRLLPWETDRNGERVVGAGTYGITLNRVLNTVFRNVTAEGSQAHWGVFGTNLNKNFVIDHCQLNRVDVHFHCWNLSITNSRIGFKGICVTGGGDLFIENTTCSSNRFINFRADFGSRWDGHIRMKHCRHILSSKQDATILWFYPDLNHDYRYPLCYGRTIQVEDLIVDASHVPDHNYWLMTIPAGNKSTGRAYFPYGVEFKNILVEGREKGLRLMRLPDFSSLLAWKSSPFDYVPNVQLLFENVMTEQMDEKQIRSGKEFHFFIEPSKKESLLYPEIEIRKCNFLVSDFGGAKMNVLFRNSLLTKINAGKKTEGKITVDSCDIAPLGYDGAPDAFCLDAEQGTTFINCIVHAPSNNGISRQEWLGQLGFMDLNKALKYNHLHTHLGNDLKKFLTKENIKVTDSFLQLLRNYYT
jgi:hypothetical protein